MSSLECICGYTFHDTDVELWRSHTQYLVTHDQLDALEMNEKAPQLREVYICPQCRAMAVQSRFDACEYEFFRPSENRDQ